AASRGCRRRRPACGRRTRRPCAHSTHAHAPRLRAHPADRLAAVIDPALLRDNPEAVKRSQIARRRSPESVDAAIAVEAQRRAALTTFEELRAEQKAFGKQVAQASKEDKPALVAKAQELAQAVKDAQAASNEAEDAYRAAIDGIENIVLDGVPA